MGEIADATIVLVGDYVDRGPQSAAVIDHLCDGRDPGFPRACLLGNHDRMLLDAVRGDADPGLWLTHGGKETLASYGIDPDSLGRRPSAAKVRQALQSVVPDEHVRWLSELPVTIETPDVIFVHAGLVPGRPVAEQADDDLIWIREPFLSSTERHGKLVVHGHTPQNELVIRPNRICVDTGAYATGRLSALRLDGSVPTRIIQVDNAGQVLVRDPSPST